MCTSEIIQELLANYDVQVKIKKFGIKVMDQVKPILAIVKNVSCIQNLSPKPRVAIRRLGTAVDLAY
jgi:hypothetical protein